MLTKSTNEMMNIIAYKRMMNIIASKGTYIFKMKKYFSGV